MRGWLWGWLARADTGGGGRAGGRWSLSARGQRRQQDARTGRRRSQPATGRRPPGGNGLGLGRRRPHSGRAAGRAAREKTTFVAARPARAACSHANAGATHCAAQRAGAPARSRRATGTRRPEPPAGAARPRRRPRSHSMKLLPLATSACPHYYHWRPAGASSRDHCCPYRATIGRPNGPRKRAYQGHLAGALWRERVAKRTTTRTTTRLGGESEKN